MRVGIGEGWGGILVEMNSTKKKEKEEETCGNKGAKLTSGMSRRMDGIELNSIAFLHALIAAFVDD